LSVDKNSARRLTGRPEHEESPLIEAIARNLLVETVTD
jgi:hypothetical protein